MLSEYLLPYMVKILPGLVLGVASLVALRRHAPSVRIFVYILIFILTRDAMTPMGLWEFGATNAFWLRFSAPGPILVILVITSAFLVVAMQTLDSEVLFRGCLQGYLETGCGMGRYHARVTSGLLFGLRHSFLALTVTAVGWPILLFATYERIACRVIRARRV